MTRKKSPERLTIPEKSEFPPMTAYSDLALVLKAAHWAHVFQVEKAEKDAIPPEYLAHGLAESRVIDKELLARNLHLN